MPVTAIGDLEITATVTVDGRSLQDPVSIARRKIPYFINSYEGNSYSGVYLGVMMFAQLPPPYNEGLYRCFDPSIWGRKEPCVTRSEPAPHMNSTTTPMETLTDAVRLAFEEAAPEQGLGRLGARQRLQYRRLGYPSRRGICLDDPRLDHLRRRRHAGAGRLARVWPGMLLRCA